MCIRDRLGTSPPRGTVGCATFPFRVGFRLLSRPLRHDDSVREGVDFGFLCLRACALLQFAFLRLALPATLTIRGRVLTVVGLAVTPFSSRPPRHTGGARQFLTDGLRLCFLQLLRVFLGFIARPFRGVEVGFEEPHLRFMV